MWPSFVWRTRLILPKALDQEQRQGQITHFPQQSMQRRLISYRAGEKGLAITLEDNGDTLLTGPVTDQAALHGLLRKVRDLGLPLLLVRCVGQDETEAPNETQPHHSEEA